jgi:preprotein translocase subunit SecG
MYQIIYVVHCVLAVVIIGAILMQVGKGAGMASAFGGASNTVFGSQGAGGFLFKFTAYLLLVFYGTSLLLSHFEHVKYQAIMDAAIPKESPVPINNQQQ